jgi:3-oxoacyl-[acyl-carrier-protein] synthase-3
MESIISQTVADAGLTVADLALVVPHQSNLRIIESACRKLGLPEGKVVINIERYGNTSAASVPVALHEAWEAGRIKPGDYVMLVAIGGGLTWATALLRV